MADEEIFKKNNLKNKKIKKEIKRLSACLKNKGIDDDKLKIANELINDISFLTVESIELKEHVHQFGTTEEYQNGEHQRGRKKSAAFEAYLNLIKQKSALIKQLTDLLPETPAPVNHPTDKEDDEFEKLLKVRKYKNEPDNAVLQQN